MSKKEPSIEALWQKHLTTSQDLAYTANEDDQVVLYKWANPHWEVLQKDGVGGLDTYIEKWMRNTLPGMYEAKHLASCVKITAPVVINTCRRLRDPESVSIALDRQILTMVKGIDGTPTLRVHDIDPKTGRINENSAILKQGKGSNCREFLYKIRVRGLVIPKYRYAGGIYDPKPLEEGSLFHRFVYSSLNEEDISDFQEFFGDLLTDTVRKAVPVLHGKPDSGKSRWLGLALKVLGKNNCASSDLGKMGPYSMASWVGKQVILIDELPKVIGDESVLKKCIGGAIVTVGRKYLGDLNVEPRWKMMIAANHLPTFSEKTTAIHTRLRVFPVKTPDQKDLIEEVDIKIAATERSLVVDWMLEGLLRIETRGRALRTSELSSGSQEIQEMSARESNPVIAWMEDAEVVLDGSVWTPKDELHGLFREWADQHGHKGFASVSSVVFYRDLFFTALEKACGDEAKQVKREGTKLTIAGLRRACLPIRVRNARDVMQAKNNDHQSTVIQFSAKEEKPTPTPPLILGPEYADPFK